MPCGRCRLSDRLRMRAARGRRDALDGRHLVEPGGAAGRRLSAPLIGPASMRARLPARPRGNGLRADVDTPQRGMSMPLRILRTKAPRPRTPDAQLGFGHVFTDHMLVMNYAPGVGWHDPRIEPYGPLALEPSTIVFHYGQAVFDGL